MRIYVGVTDRDWFDFLRARPDLDEVNFWRPSGSRGFGAIGRGDLLLFKLHYPANAIVGGGTFVSHDAYPAWLVWDAFHEKNGAPSYAAMRARIEHYRKAPMSEVGIEQVGCIILRDPFFFDQPSWIKAPADWSPNIVQGKTYDAAQPQGQRLLHEVNLRRVGVTLRDATAESHAPMWGDPMLARRRLGQGSFQLMIVGAYNRQCAVTREKALPVLESAHIRPVTQGGLHQVGNGILLRSDVHTLFDRGYVTITPKGEFRASRRLKSDYNNGEPYYALERLPVALPENEANRPLPELLEWHNDAVFRAA